MARPCSDPSMQSPQERHWNVAEIKSTFSVLLPINFDFGTAHIALQCKQLRQRLPAPVSGVGNRLVLTGLNAQKEVQRHRVAALLMYSKFNQAQNPISPLSRSQ